MLFLGFTLGRELLKSREIQKEIAQLQAQADTLAARNIKLSELETAVQTQSFIEREARLKLGMKKFGEEVVVIQERGEEGGASVEWEEETNGDPLGLILDAKTQAPSVANSTKWWYYFFNKKAYDELAHYES